jgi:hypothetical protein
MEFSTQISPEKDEYWDSERNKEESAWQELNNERFMQKTAGITPEERRVVLEKKIRAMNAPDFLSLFWKGLSYYRGFCCDQKWEAEPILMTKDIIGKEITWAPWKTEGRFEEGFLRKGRDLRVMGKEALSHYDRWNLYTPIPGPLLMIKVTLWETVKDLLDRLEIVYLKYRWRCWYPSDLEWTPKDDLWQRRWKKACADELVWDEWMYQLFMYWFLREEINQDTLIFTSFMFLE